MNELTALVEQVEKLIHNKESRLSIVVETGYDESGLVGTKDAYLRLVKEVLQFLDAAERGDVAPITIGELNLPSSPCIGELFDPKCEIELDTTTLTSSDAETEKVVDYFFWLSPWDLEGEQTNS